MKGIVFHQDNAPAHKSVELCKIWLLYVTGFEVVDHPPHSLDLGPSDYFLFPNMKVHVAGKLRYWTDDVVISAVEDFSRIRMSAAIPHEIKNPSAATPMEEVCRLHGRPCWK